jgi:hypothetical protein
VLHDVPKGGSYHETLEAMKGRFRDQHLTTIYRSQPKMRTLDVGESLQEFATALEQLTHQAYPALPKDDIRRETGKAFADGVEDLAIKIQLLFGGQKTMNEALRQALEQQAPKKSARIFWGSRRPLTG